MAYIVGYVDKEEKAALEKAGWDVEPAERYNLVGDLHEYLLSGAHEDDEAVVIYVDNSIPEVFQLLFGNPLGGANELEQDPDAHPEGRTPAEADDDDANRCEHGMFFSGAGACPKCGGGAD